MCLAIPMKVVNIQDDFCAVEMNGVKKSCFIGFLEELPREGDYLLVHTGVAIKTLKPEETEEILRELRLLLDGEL
jgi:hydrogenase expression/formation protein HypC